MGKNLIVRVNNMLREIKQSGKKLRWFTDEEIDLFIWYEDDRVIGFQLCYDKTKYERAFTWYKDGREYHHSIDAGEASPNKNMSPILVQDGYMNAKEVKDKFIKRAKNIDSKVTKLVTSILKQKDT